MADLRSRNDEGCSSSNYGDTSVTSINGTIVATYLCQRDTCEYCVCECNESIFCSSHCPSCNSYSNSGSCITPTKTGKNPNDQGRLLGSPIAINSYTTPVTRRRCCDIPLLPYGGDGMVAPMPLRLVDSLPGLCSNGPSISKFLDLFPNILFDCYRSILPYIRLASSDAWEFVNRCLPISGPVSAASLGYLLAHVTFVFDLDDVRLPVLLESVLEGYEFLHFDASSFEPIRSTIIKLLSFKGFVGASAIDPMQMINTAATVGATTIASNEASAVFRNSLDAMTTVRTVLSHDDQALITKERRYVRFTQEQNVTNDHPYLAGCREIVRSDYERVSRIKTIGLRTLVLGSSSREFRMYEQNPHVFFQISNREGKDVDRMVVDCLESLRKIKVKKLGGRKLTNVNSIQRAREGLLTIDKMLVEWRTTRSVPERFLMWEESQDLLTKGTISGPDGCEQPIQCAFDVLIFEDVGYNFVAKDWYNIFKNTGAVVAYGYMCLPWELIFDDVVSPPGYKFKKEDKLFANCNIATNYSYLAYSGYSNGYVHPTEAWATLLKAPAMVFKDFCLGIEIVSRIGPMACIKIYRCTEAEVCTRVLELPPFLKTTRLLDVRRSVSPLTGVIDFSDLKYFAVRTEEFEDALNYALDIAKESLNFRNILLYIRRRTSSISLVTKDITKTWSAPKGLLPEFAFAVYLYALYLTGKFDELEHTHSSFRFTPIYVCVKTYFGSMFRFLDSIINLFLSKKFGELIVKDVDHSKWQTVWLTTANKPAMVSVEPSFDDCFPEGFDFKTKEVLTESPCGFCDEFNNAVSGQKVHCNRNVDECYYHDFALSTEEVTALKTRLADTDTDAVGLKSTKDEALKKMPPSGFNTRVKVQYICGPPGTGKSYAIRALATKDDIVIGPFSRLKSDYTNFVHPKTGKRMTLKFYTQHLGFSALNHSRVFVDEYTAMPYECLAVILHNCAASEVILVGDHRQTSLINEVEGISIPTKIPLTDIRQHELVRNFRNPVDAVVVLNTLYNYRMIPSKVDQTKDKPFAFDNVSNYEKYSEHTPLFFSYATAQKFGVVDTTSQKVTVRANQGATFDKVRLVVTKGDVHLFNMPSMTIVALSRHRYECVILHDDSDEASVFAGRVKSVDYKKPPSDESPKGSQYDSDDSNGNDGPPRRFNTDSGNVPGSSKYPYRSSKGETKSWRKITKTFIEKTFSSVVDSSNTISSAVLNTMPTVIQTVKNYKVFPNKIHPTDEEEEVFYDFDEVPDLEWSDDYKAPSGEALETPASNNCLLQALHELSGVSMDDIWHAFTLACDEDIRSRVLTVGLSTEDLNCVCHKYKFRVRVVNGDKTIICGTRGKLIGTLKFSGPIDDGHYEVFHDYTVSPSNSLKRSSSSGTSNLSSVSWDLSSTMKQKNTVPSFRVKKGKSKVILRRRSVDNSQFKDDFDIPHHVGTPESIVNFDLGDTTSDEMVGGIEGFEAVVKKEGFPKFYTNRKNEVKNFGNPINIPSPTTSPTRSVDNDVTEHDIDMLLCNVAKIVSLSPFEGRRQFKWAIMDILLGRHAYRFPGTAEDWETLFSSPKRKKGFLEFVSKRRKQAFLALKRVVASGDARLMRSLSTGCINPKVHKNVCKSKKKWVPKWTGKGKKDTVVKPLPQLEVVEPKPIAFVPLDSASLKFVDLARSFTDPIRVTEHLVEMFTESEDIHVPMEQSSYDSFRMLSEDFATNDEYNFIVTNQEALGYFDKNFSTGIFDLTTVDNLNQRGHPKKGTTKAWSLLNVAPGVTYFKTNLSQSLGCLSARYLTKAYQTTFSTASADKAREIADLFFDEHMKSNWDIFNEQDMWSTTLESEHSMKIKSYETQCKYELAEESDVRFTMKDIFKPFKTKVDLYKAGQGISAWSKDNQTIFQTSYRVLNKHFINSLCDHVVYDNGIDEMTLMNRVNALFSVLPETAMNGVIDATACDSGQNRFTQMIERRILERMGVDNTFLDWYYAIRQKYMLRGYGVSATIHDIKTSGEPATLLNNTILMACLMNYLVRGEGPCVLVIKGDDGLKRQANLSYSNELKKSLKNHLKMEFKVDLNVPISFCGYFLHSSNLVPDIIRKVFKILGHKFKDYIHFCEYQQSLRDWVLNVNKLGLSSVCEITAQSYGIQFEYAYSLFHSIVSLTHISESQFHKTFTLRTYDWNVEYPVGEPWSKRTPWYEGFN